MDMSVLTSLFGWMLLINIGIYALAAMFIIFARDFTIGLEARITGVPEAEWPKLLMDYLSRYKIAILMFNFAPYIALRMMG